MIAEDVHQAVMKHLQDNWTECTVQYPAVPFSSTGLTEWIKPVVQAAGRPCREGEQDRLVALVVYIMHATSDGNAYRVQQLADALGAEFGQKSIATSAGRTIRFKEGQFAYFPQPAVASAMSGPGGAGPGDVERDGGAVRFEGMVIEAT